MKCAAIILAIALSGCAHTRESVLFAESKCKEGYEYWFLNRAAAHTELIGAEMLINGGANVDGKGYETFVACGGSAEYSSPLFVAVSVVAHEEVSGDPQRSDRKYVLAAGMEMVELLLKAGANPNIREGEGSTPLDLAKQLGHEPTVALLKQYGAT
jgi:hypothetical protein